MKIFYGVCGEGMGHAGRSLALIERLAALGHRVTIFTFADALRLLNAAGYSPVAIDGLQFSIAKHGGVSPLRSCGNLASYLRNRHKSLDVIRQVALAEQPDLVITDFEPLTALAAASLRIPCVSVDNQHRFCHPLGRDFPWFLQCYSRLAGVFVRGWIRGPRQCIVAVFHDCPASRHYQHVDVLLRERIASVQPSDGNHILLYGRGELGRRIALAASGVSEQFVAFGFDGPPAPNIEYRPTDNAAFVSALASCRAVITSAGQQLIGEARYFGKPLLVVPMPKQHEQEINARYARQEGLGDYCPLAELSPERIEDFLRRRFTRHRPGNGVDQTLDLMGISHGKVA
ncbi:MAG TPA: glycosyltransferase family protein [Pirellulales bacterium]|jgi:uncharacterized protein (TIGR00661 family)